MPDLIRAKDQESVWVSDRTAIGPGFALFQDVGTVTVTNVRTTRIAWLLDRVTELALKDFMIEGVGTPASPAAALNGRWRQWVHVNISRGLIRNVAGDGIHFPGGWATGAMGRYAPVVQGEISDVLIRDIQDTDAHSDAIQCAGASLGLMLRRVEIRNAPSALQFTPAQNHANDAGTGSGQSVGLGSHRALRLEDCAFTNAGPARIFNAPMLELDGCVITGEHSKDTLDIRGTQGAVPTKALPWVTAHPLEDWTTIRVFRNCTVDRLLIEEEVKFEVDDPGLIGGNKIGTIFLPDGTRHPLENFLRALLEQPLEERGAPEPSPVLPEDAGLAGEVQALRDAMTAMSGRVAALEERVGKLDQ